MSTLPTIYERIEYREAKPTDIPALRELFDSQLGHPLGDSFFDTVTKYVKRSTSEEEGSPAQKAPAFLVLCAVDKVKGYSPVLAGAIVLRFVNLQEAKSSVEGGKRLLSFEVLETPYPAAVGAFVEAIALTPRYRRHGLGAELLEEAVVTAAGRHESLEASLVHVKTSDEPSIAFFRSQNYTCVGLVPRHFQQPEQQKHGGKAGKSGRPEPEDAYVYACTVRGLALAEYKSAGKGKVPDLTSPTLARVTRTPPWVRDVFLQFVLPLLAVALLFGISYLLVWLGPLKGISGENWGVEDAGNGNGAVDVQGVGDGLMPYELEEVEL